MKIVIDGIDNLGKTTIVKELRRLKNFDIDIHLTAPKDLGTAMYMYRVFFSNLEKNKSIIYDRSHLGEIVYAPLYRNYSAKYIYDMEKLHNLDDVRLVLLVGDTSIVEDDGLSHNYDNRELEQKVYLEAFDRSIIKDKRIVEVHKHGSFRDVGAIIKDIL